VDPARHCGTSSGELALAAPSSLVTWYALIRRHPSSGFTKAITWLGARRANPWSPNRSSGTRWQGREAIIRPSSVAPLLSARTSSPMAYESSSAAGTSGSRGPSGWDAVVRRVGKPTECLWCCGSRPTATHPYLECRLCSPHPVAAIAVVFESRPGVTFDRRRGASQPSAKKPVWHS